MHETVAAESLEEGFTVSGRKCIVCVCRILRPEGAFPGRQMPCNSFRISTLKSLQDPHACLREDSLILIATPFAVTQGLQEFYSVGGR